MRSRIAFKIVTIVIVVVFLFSTGFWLGINFNFIKKYIFKTGTSNVTETDSNNLNSNITSNSISIESINEALDLVYRNALSKKSMPELIRVAIEGILTSLDDKHAEYYSMEEYNQIMESYNGTISGIGILISEDDEGRKIVVMPIESSPAYRAGIKEGDIITEVDGVNIEDMSLDKVVALIKGEEGTSVNLTIYRESEDKIFDVDLIRETIYIPNLFSEILEDNIGYIQYFGFQENGAQKLKEEIEKLIDDGAEGIIFDLRNNLGGVLSDAVEVCDLFLNEGTIVTVKGRKDNKESLEEFKAKNGIYTEISLIVLTNEFSASASELVAGSLQENDRAIIVGEKSFGKGTVQVLYELSDGSGIKFTTAKYYLPSGISIEGEGIRPDILVNLSPDDKEDLQLNKAVEEMQSSIKKSVAN